MSAASLLRYARQKANLSQRELGARAGVTQATISRIEERKISPRFDTLERLLFSCGFELQVVPRRGVEVDRSAIRELLKMSPKDRARLAVAESRNLEKIQPHRTDQ